MAGPLSRWNNSGKTRSYRQDSAEQPYRIQEESATLEPCDDGPGFPEGFDPKSLATTGISLVENLSRWDLCGSAQYLNRPEGGARVVIRMPLSLPSA